jgi:streptogramin lyase
MNIPCKQCKSDSDWEGAGVHDNPRTGFAFNLYLCGCGAILKQNVWKDSGNTWILENGEVIKDRDDV